MGNSSSSGGGRARDKDRKQRGRKQQQQLQHEDEQVMSTRPTGRREFPGEGRGGGPPAQYLGYDPTTPPQHPLDPRHAAFRKDVRLLPELNARRSPASSVAEEETPHYQQLQRPFTYTPQPHALPQRPQPQHQPQALQQRRPQTVAENPAAARGDKKNRRRDKDKEKARGKENVMVRPEELPGYSILPLKQGFDPEPPPERAPPEDGVLRSDTARRDFRRRLEHQLEQPRRVSPCPDPPADSLEDYARREDPRGAHPRLPPEQLRSALPWSYLAAPEDQLPRHARPDPQGHAELEMPPVPVPDYTLHFGQRSRDRLPSPSPDRTSGYERDHRHHNGMRHSKVLY